MNRRPLVLAPREARFLWLATAAVGVEAAALAVSAIWLLVHRLTGAKAHDSLDYWFLVGLAAFGAVALGWTTRGLAYMRRWARSPAVLTALIVVGVGVNEVSRATALGIALLVVGIAGVVGLFAPSTTRLLVGGPQ